MGIIIFLLKDCKNEKGDPYWKDPNFKTDTIKVDKPYAVKGDSFPYKVPPLIIIKYEKDTSNKNSIKCINDSLIKVIDSLGNQLSQINKSFLTQFPNSYKLIGGFFSLDTLKLDLLDVTGNISTQFYPVDYQNYDYQWYNDKMRAREISYISSSGQSKQKQFSLYGNVGYGLLSKKPMLSMSGDYSIKRFKLSAEPSISIQQNPELNVDLKLGYKIR